MTVAELIYKKFGNSSHLNIIPIRMREAIGDLLIRLELGVIWIKHRSKLFALLNLILV